MRIRSTKPEFWKSRRVTSVPWDARLVLKGLESYVDDNGVGVDDIELIVTDVFPRDMFANPRETVARVSEAISLLHQAGLVHRYQGANDPLLYISFWESIQRIDKPGRGRNPRPDGTLEYKDSEIRESVASVPEVVAPGTGEQGNRGTGEQAVVTLSAAEAADPEPAFVDVELPLEEPDAPDESTSTGYPPDFTAFWDVYPRRQGKGQACAAFLKAKKRAPVTRIIDGATRLRDDPNLPTDRSLIPMPSTWLNQDRWEDDPLPARMSDLTSSQRRLVQAAQQSQHRQAVEAQNGVRAFQPHTNPFAGKEITR